MATQFVDRSSQVTSAPAHPVAAAPAPRRYLFGPRRDFLTFGGSSLMILPLLMLLGSGLSAATFAVWTTMLAHFVNNPHFGHSYQLFYRGFYGKAIAGRIGREMQLRYLFAGVVAPAALVAYLAWGVATHDRRMLGYAGNAMALFVGWHYVKQGYGLLMVDCALKKQFFGDRDKKILVVNAYAVWIAVWCYGNRTAARSELWGIEYFAFDLPRWLVAIAFGVAVGTTAMAAAAFWRAWRGKATLPWNGLLAYGVSIYLWLAFVSINPLWLLIVPALHSLQYLAVVWRFETNYAASMHLGADGELSASRGGRAKFAMHLGLFAVIAALLGFLAFWGTPLLLTWAMAEPQTALGAGVFLFTAWIFVNTHHYFMDNVMWRRNNPDTKKYLFG